ncbi:hypothetical protein Tco_1066673 [Tanacetum coccineum]|uniref:Uncharacterized protein n=1 Tax=Tanacetum coccineum TaxID=301880 RepID=A0ABQ5HC34_9ASTR
MTTLQFADTHNLVVFLAKPVESEGFEQVAIVKVKTVNGEQQLQTLVDGKKIVLQALVDGKKIIITEATIRRDRQLEDADGVDCLPNAIIFEQLTLMGVDRSVRIVFSEKLVWVIRNGDEVVVKSEVTNKAGEKRYVVEEAVVVTDAVTIPVSATTITNVELTLAQTLAELKSARPKTKGVVMQETSESTPIISLQLSSHVKGQGSKDKGKAKMIEPEKPLKKIDQIKFDEEEALRLQAKFDEEDRLAREKAQQVEEADIAWDDIQAKIDADYQLAERLQAQKQQELTMKRELVEGTKMEESSKKAEVMEESSSKRAGDELQQESTKKQKMDDDQERAELQNLMNVIPDEEEVAADAIPLATKPSSIIVTTSRYVVPTGRVKVPAGRYVVPTAKDNVIVSAGRSKVIPAGRTILVLNGNNKKKKGRDPKGINMKLPPVSVEEHIAFKEIDKKRSNAISVTELGRLCSEECTGNIDFKSKRLVMFLMPAARNLLLWVYLPGLPKTRKTYQIASMSSRSKFGLGFGETFGSDEVFDPSAPSIFDTIPEDVEGKPSLIQLGLYNKPIRHNVANIPSFVPRATYVPAGSRNPPASVSAGSAFPAGSRNNTKHLFCWLGLAVITNCTWMREDGELLLRPQQVVLGKLKGHICSGDPRTMVDLINLHGLTLK